MNIGKKIKRGIKNGWLRYTYLFVLGVSVIGMIISTGWATLGWLVILIYTGFAGFVFAGVEYYLFKEWQRLLWYAPSLATTLPLLIQWTREYLGGTV